MKSFGSILNEHKGIGPGFDFLRLALAVAIFTAHTAAICETRGLIPSLFDLIRGAFLGVLHAEDLAAPMRDTISRGTPWLRPIVVTHVPMFFALSGFLVTGSALRTKRVFPFLSLRFFRIFPALCVEVALSAILIGSIFTTLPLADYFTNREFFSYFGNIAGFVQMELPGVMFWKSDVVNANLWTLPAEFYSYLILAGLMFTGIAFDRAVSTAIFAVATAALIAANMTLGFDDTPWLIAANVNVYYFFMGMMFFHWKDHIPRSLVLLGVSIALAYALGFWPKGVFLAPALVTYIAVFIGTTEIPWSRLIESGDYSYGIYLYGFPISQMVITTMPALRGNYLAFTATTLLLTALFAVFSWHAIERRFLRLRKRIPTTPANTIQERTA